MRFFIDTEFNGFNGELLSIALVGEDGNVFYAVLEYHESDLTEWVKEHVYPYLHIGPDPHHHGIVHKCQDKLTVQQQLSTFLSQYPDGVEIIADWPEDITHLCQLMIVGPGYMIDTPMIMSFVVDRSLETESLVPHNAYYDALANRNAWLKFTRSIYLEKDN